MLRNPIVCTLVRVASIEISLLGNEVCAPLCPAFQREPMIAQRYKLNVRQGREIQKKFSPLVRSYNAADVPGNSEPFTWQHYVTAARNSGRVTTVAMETQRTVINLTPCATRCRL